MDILKYCSELDSIMSESPKKKKLLKESSVKKPVKNSQKNHRINENFGNDGYMYLTKHGLGPGTLPKDVHLLKSKDLPHYMTAIWLDRFLTTDELKKFDIYPETEIRRVMDFYDISEKDLLDESLTEDISIEDVEWNNENLKGKSVVFNKNVNFNDINSYFDDEPEHNRKYWEKKGLIVDDDGVVVIPKGTKGKIVKYVDDDWDPYVKIKLDNNKTIECGLDQDYNGLFITDNINESLKRNRRPLKEDNNTHIDKVIVELDDENEYNAYEVDGHILEDKYGFYQGIIFLDDDKSQESIKKLGIKPGDKFIIGIRESTPKEEKYYGSNVMVDILSKLKEDSNKYIDKIIVELDDEDGDYAYEVRGNKLHNKYGFYQGVIILEDDESQERLKKLGIKPGDEFVVGIRKPTPEEQEMYDDVMDDTFYMTDILYRYNESFKRNKRPLKEESNRRNRLMTLDRNIEDSDNILSKVDKETKKEFVEYVNGRNHTWEDKIDDWFFAHYPEYDYDIRIEDLDEEELNDIISSLKLESDLKSYIKGEAYHYILQSLRK